MVFTPEEKAEFRARLLATLEPKPKPPAPNVEQRTQERVNPNNTPTPAVIDAASAHVDAATRRMRQEAKESAEAQDPRARYQRELDRFWQSQRDFEASLDEWDYSTGYREPRYHTTCHRGPGDPDWGL